MGTQYSTIGAEFSVEYRPIQKDMLVLRIVLILLLMPLLNLAAAEAQEIVRFQTAGSPPTPLQKRMAKLRGDEAKGAPGIKLQAQLYRPANGEKPFPALVLLHGCLGITAAIEDWAFQLADWGYLTLVVDSYGPRRHRPDCGRFDYMESVDQTFDALDALRYLSGRTDVDGRRIGLMGWSIGGSKVLAALNSIGVQNLYPEKFRYGISFYPYCLSASGPFISPLLMLIGEADDWTLARRCRKLAKANERTDHPPDLKVFPAGYHFFDDPDQGAVRYHVEIQNLEKSPPRGVTWGYDPAAHKASIKIVRDFLDQQSN